MVYDVIFQKTAAWNVAFVTIQQLVRSRKRLRERALSEIFRFVFVLLFPSYWIFGTNKLRFIQLVRTHSILFVLLCSLTSVIFRHTANDRSNRAVLLPAAVYFLSITCEPQELRACFSMPVGVARAQGWLQISLQRSFASEMHQSTIVGELKVSLFQFLFCDIIYCSVTSYITCTVCSSNLSGAYSVAKRWSDLRLTIVLEILIPMTTALTLPTVHHRALWRHQTKPPQARPCVVASIDPTSTVDVINYSQTSFIRTLKNRNPLHVTQDR